jgi:hypothetical protein
LIVTLRVCFSLPHPSELFGVGNVLAIMSMWLKVVLWLSRQYTAYSVYCASIKCALSVVSRAERSMVREEEEQRNEVDTVDNPPDTASLPFRSSGKW